VNLSWKTEKKEMLEGKDGASEKDRSLRSSCVKRDVTEANEKEIEGEFGE